MAATPWNGTLGIVQNVAGVANQLRDAAATSATPAAAPPKTLVQLATEETAQASVGEAPAITTYKPAAFDTTKLTQAATSGYTAAQAGPAVQAAQTQAGPAVQAAQTQAVMDEKKGLVQNQLTKIIDQNSPLMQRAAARANAASNARGLLNSSIAVGAGQGAVIDAATPIAQADAAAVNDFAKLNATEANRIGMFNAGETNTTSRFNAAEANRIGMFNAGETNTTSRFNVSESNTASRFSADAANASARDFASASNSALGKEYDAQTAAGQKAADAANALAQTRYTTEANLAIHNTDAINQTIKDNKKLNTQAKDSMLSMLGNAQSDYLTDMNRLEATWNSPDHGGMTQQEYRSAKVRYANTFLTMQNSAKTTAAVLSDAEINSLLQFTANTNVEATGIVEQAAAEPAAAEQAAAEQVAGFW